MFLNDNLYQLIHLFKYIFICFFTMFRRKYDEEVVEFITRCITNFQYIT